MSNNNKRNQPFTMGANLGSGWESDNKTKVIRQEKILMAEAHELVIKKEKRKGKTVTVIGEFFIAGDMKKKLAGDVKKKLSTGGSMSDSFLELQGDVADAARELLESMGYRFKKSKK